MLEVKADALEASFEALEREDEDVAALREEVAALKARVDAQAVAGARPALAGAKSEASPFVERYLRKGLEAGRRAEGDVGRDRRRRRLCGARGARRGDRRGR